ncbi:MAG: hypothetical protein A4E60_00248 [Syntrophorhabdus sp. PtaB.Bin047]|jgi:hypothetical protein|nr:MAG: hypothetical protein A4E60_00248 [Syntrophorhabdus sp. PtaB.Bin047]
MGESSIVTSPEFEKAYENLKETFDNVSSGKFSKKRFYKFYMKFCHKDKPLTHVLKEVNERHGLKASDIDNRSLVFMRKLFSPSELGALLGCTPENITQRVGRGEQELVKEGHLANVRISGTNLNDINVTDTYVDALRTLTTILNTSTSKTDQIRAIESVLKYIEPKVIEELKGKFKTLNALINFFIAYLIPEANKRIREIIRELQEKPKEEIAEAVIDLRVVFRDLLPKSPDLNEFLEREGWLK